MSESVPVAPEVDGVRTAPAEPTLRGALELYWLNGYERVIDLRSSPANGKVFTWLQRAEKFQTVQIDEYGHAISRAADGGYQIDFGADSPRRGCERQAEIHTLRVG